MAIGELLNKLGLAAESQDKRRKNANVSLHDKRIELWSFEKLELSRESEQNNHQSNVGSQHHHQRYSSYNR